MFKVQHLRPSLALASFWPLLYRHRAWPTRNSVRANLWSLQHSSHLVCYVLYDQTIVAYRERREAVKPGFLLRKHLFQLPQPELPEVQHDLHGWDAPHTPAHLDCVVLGMFCDFQDFEWDVSVLQVSDCSQKRHCLYIMIQATEKGCREKGIS